MPRICTNTNRPAICDECGAECDCVFNHQTHTHTCFQCGNQTVFR